MFNEISLKIVVVFLLHLYYIALTVFQVLGYSQIVGRLYYSRGLISPLALFLPDVYKALIYVIET